MVVVQAFLYFSLISCWSWFVGIISELVTWSADEGHFVPADPLPTRQCVSLGWRGNRTRGLEQGGCASCFLPRTCWSLLSLLLSSSALVQVVAPAKPLWSSFQEFVACHPWSVERSCILEESEVVSRLI